VVLSGMGSLQYVPALVGLGQVAVSRLNTEDGGLLLLLKAVDRALFLFSGTGWIVYVWACVCARVWMQGRRRDRMRYVMYHSAGWCIAVMFNA